MGTAFLSQFASTTTTVYNVTLSVSSTNQTHGVIKYLLGTGIAFSSFSFRYLVISKSVNEISSNGGLNYFSLAGNCANISSGSGPRMCTAVGNFTNGTGQVIDLSHTNFLLIWANTMIMTTISGKGF